MWPFIKKNENDEEKYLGFDDLIIQLQKLIVKYDSSNCVKCMSTLQKLNKDMRLDKAPEASRISSNLIPLILKIIESDEFDHEHQTVIQTLTNIVAYCEKNNEDWNKPLLERILRNRMSIILNEISKNSPVYCSLRAFTVECICCVFNHLSELNEDTILKLHELKICKPLQNYLGADYELFIKPCLDKYTGDANDKGFSNQPIPIWEKGKENPFTMDISIDSIGMKLTCPICHNEIFYQNPKIHSIHGGAFECHTCKDILHVPGALLSNASRRDLKITAGVLVKIFQWSEWYHSHPLFLSLLKTQNTNLHDDYGLWAYCAQCHHQYKRTVLSVFSLFQESKGGGFVAKSPESAKDMEALSSGHCPSCKHDTLIAIMTDVPDYALKAIDTAKRTGFYPLE